MDLREKIGKDCRRHGDLIPWSCVRDLFPTWVRCEDGGLEDAMDGVNSRFVVDVRRIYEAVWG
jgi:hypothetical protein